MQPNQCSCTHAFTLALTIESGPIIALYGLNIGMGVTNTLYKVTYNQMTDAIRKFKIVPEWAEISLATRAKLKARIDVERTGC